MMFRKKVAAAPVAKSYKVIVAPKKHDDAKAPTFHVAIEHATFSLGHLPNKSMPGLAIVLADNESLVISLTPKENFDDVDNIFRSVLGELNKDRLTTRDLDEILSQYKTYLRVNSIASKFEVSKDYSHQYQRPSGNKSM